MVIKIGVRFALILVAVILFLMAAMGVVTQRLNLMGLASALFAASFLFV